MVARRPAPFQLQDIPRREVAEGVSARRAVNTVPPLSVGHDAPSFTDRQFHATFSGYTPAKPLRDVGLSADAQAKFRTLTGWRPVVIDESASLIDSGAL